jgi:hypothetical protein
MKISQKMTETADSWFESMRGSAGSYRVNRTSKTECHQECHQKIDPDYILAKWMAIVGALSWIPSGIYIFHKWGVL